MKRRKKNLLFLNRHCQMKNIKLKNRKKKIALKEQFLTKKYNLYNWIV